MVSITAGVFQGLRKRSFLQAIEFMHIFPKAFAKSGGLQGRGTDKALIKGGLMLSKETSTAIQRQKGYITSIVRVNERNYTTEL